jgi:ribosomal protein S18 acetylase RimI-like enzyme
MVRVREGCPEDLDFVVEFNRLLAQETEDKELDLEALRPGVARALSSPELCRYFVAESDGEVVGQTMITYEWSDWRNGLIWWIQSVYVRTEYRGSGVFRALFDRVESEAKADGNVRAIRLYVDKDNENAMKVYDQIGMCRSDYVMFEKEFS